MKPTRAMTAAIGLVLFGLAGPAIAEESREAEALIRKGVKLRAEGKDERALPVFESAYQASRTPRTAGQLGLAELAVGYCVEAERYLQDALAAPDHPWVSKNLGMLKEQLAAAQGRIGELTVTGTPAGAEVSVNGKRIGQLPMPSPVRLDKGRVSVDVRAAGHVSASEVVTIAGGDKVQRSFALTREPSAAAAPPPAPSPVPAAKPAPVEAPPTAATPEGAPSATDAPARSPAVTVNVVASDGAGPARPLAWIAAGAAVVGIGLGTYGAVTALDKQDAFESHTGLVNGVLGKDCGTEALTLTCRGIKDDHDRALTLTIIGFAAGGALAVAATTLFIVSTPERGASSTALACAPELGRAGVSCALRF